MTNAKTIKNCSKNIAGTEAIALLDEAIKQFRREHCGQNGVIYMSECFAHALAGYSGDDAPASPGEIIRHGEAVFERDGFDGWSVFIEPGDGGFRIEPVPLENPESDGF